MAQMSKLSALTLDYLFGDRSVWKSDEELAATVRELGDKLRDQLSEEA
jgi:hypothetical protein